MPIEDDDLLESIETFFGNIRFPAGGDSFDSIMFAPSTASASITDNEGECMCTLDIQVLLGAEIYKTYYTSRHISELTSVISVLFSEAHPLVHFSIDK